MIDVKALKESYEKSTLNEVLESYDNVKDEIESVSDRSEVAAAVVHKICESAASDKPIGEVMEELIEAGEEF